MNNKNPGPSMIPHCGSGPGFQFNNITLFSSSQVYNGHRSLPTGGSQSVFSGFPNRFSSSLTLFGHGWIDLELG